MSVLLGVPEHARREWEQLMSSITEPTPCAGPNRDDWTGTAAQQERAADACHDCPVMHACLTYADTAGEAAGVWGGLTAPQRATQQEGIEG